MSSNVVATTCADVGAFTTCADRDQSVFYDDAAVGCLSEFTKDGRVVAGNPLGKVDVLGSW